MHEQIAGDLLERWVSAADAYFHELPAVPGGGAEKGHYGCGYNAWSVQTNQKYLSAMAVFACAAPVDDSRREVRAFSMRRALAAFRFMLESHKAGGGVCADGTSWGHTWISTLGLERMLHALKYLDPELTEAERVLLRVVLSSEADWLLRDYFRGNKQGILATRWSHEGGNDPESNIWNGAFLWRVAHWYPDHVDAAAWRERALAFLANGISIVEDACCEDIFDGKPLRDRHLGASFFQNYALDHHGYFNLGYMVICLSNIAILHFDSKLCKFPVPRMLYLHAKELWEVTKKMIFADGRLARIGGDTRVRYAYCQEYLVPVLLLAADLWRDPHALELLENQLRTIRNEADHNGDGSFYGRRLETMRRADPVYYTRLESDRANVLGMLAAYMPIMDVPQHADDFEEAVAGSWAEPEHGEVLNRGKHRLAAFAWRSAYRGQGMCLPPDNGDLAEWEGQLTGRIQLLGQDFTPKGRRNTRLLDSYEIKSFAGGFLTWGALFEGGLVRLGEGWSGEKLCRHQVVFCALPDGHTVIGLEWAEVANIRAWFHRATGLGFDLPNDLFNGFTRVLETPEETWELRRDHNPVEVECMLHTQSLRIDKRIGISGVYGGNGFLLERPKGRSAGTYNSLYLESLHYGGRGKHFWADPAENVLDCGWMVASHAHELEMDWLFNRARPRQLPWAASAARAVEVTGLNGKTYRLAANFGSAPVSLAGLFEAPSQHARWTDLEQCSTVTADKLAGEALASECARCWVADT